ncbi:MAG: deoxyguanosinetriphosphate triphosphohydrolase [Chloroflexaceae bacterium]|nr:deoxyguanosinetriphosphate triphosphohydrolase [Chloroflexaceae bacterium]NJO04712.1 deoxyguanosinetriphosphate triphosphohydrolase [Chloroflexaceae bacterium]
MPVASRSIRERSEAIEDSILSPLATRSAGAVRLHREAECNTRTAFQRDRDRIIHSKSFRRLKHKTQVFISPQGDHYRTRLTHTLEVTQIARTIARALRLNEDLTEAIGVGHDLGHAPFGHAGERALTIIYPGKFRHNAQSARIVEVLEKDGQGLNLTTVVCEGIYLHSKGRRDISATAWGNASTLEGQIIKVADSVAYINHDIDDAIRGGIIRSEDLPADCIAVLGTRHAARIDTMVRDLIEHNWWATGEGEPPADQVLVMSAPVLEATNQLREFMFQNVYLNSRAKEEDNKVVVMLELLYNHFLKHPQQLPADLLRINQQREEPIERAVVDYIAGMTDRYALKKFEALYVPRTWMHT